MDVDGAAVDDKLAILGLDSAVKHAMSGIVLEVVHLFREKKRRVERKKGGSEQGARGGEGEMEEKGL